MGRRKQSRTGGRGADRPRPIARRTGRPAKHLPAAVSAARRLTEPETLEQLRLTESQIAFLDRCAEGRPPRNALAAITALKLKLEFSQSKPKQKHEVEPGAKLAELLAAAMGVPQPANPDEQGGGS